MYMYSLRCKLPRSRHDLSVSTELVEARRGLKEAARRLRVSCESDDRLDALLQEEALFFADLLI